MRGLDAMIALELLVIVALVLVNAVFSGAEIALVSAQRTRLQQLAAGERRGPARRAAAALRLRAEPERFFATVQIGITVVSATAGAWGGATFARHIEPSLSRVPALEEHAEGLSVAIVVAVVSYLSIVLGELVPKSLALKYAESYATLVARPLLVLSAVARPLVWFLSASSNLLLRPFGDRTTFVEGRLSAEELRDLVKEASETGAMDQHVGEIASRAFDFAGLSAKDVMTPRKRIDAIPLDATRERLRDLLLERGHSRMPVYRGSIDDIAGYVVVKDVFGLVWEGDLIILQDLLRPAFFVPETMPARTVLRELKKRRTQIAIVVDEHGGTSGLVTLTDILEELVGALEDEDAREEPIRKDADGVIARGDTPVRHVNRALGLELPQGEGWTTIGGLCLHFSRGMPPPGARLEIAGVATLEVVEATATSVVWVKIRPSR